MHAYIWVPGSEQGRPHTLWAPSLGSRGPGDSDSGTHGVCGHLCVRACRHVLSEEAPVTQSHGVCASCVDVSMCAGGAEALAPRGWGKWL